MATQLGMFDHMTTIETRRIDFKLHELVLNMFDYGTGDAECDYVEARRIYTEVWTDLANDLHDGEVDALRWVTGLAHPIENIVVRSLRGNWLELHTFDEYGALSTTYINSAKDFMNKADEDGVTVDILRIGR